jgi:thiol:disulfide interchange protein DsbA
VPAGAAASNLQGQFQQLNEPSTHQPGKVEMTEFADFYCPHCHLFEQTALPLLEEEFGRQVQVTMVGFPVIPGMLPTPFEMYEQARMMGKGPEMKRVLFRTIHRDRTLILDRRVRAILASEVGLDPGAFERGLASGKPARALQEGKEWGKRINVNSTPTVLLDGNIKIEGKDLTPDNLKTVIRSILDADAKR